MKPQWLTKTFYLKSHIFVYVCMYFCTAYHSFLWVFNSNIKHITNNRWCLENGKSLLEMDKPCWSVWLFWCKSKQNRSIFAPILMIINHFHQTLEQSMCLNQLKKNEYLMWFLYKIIWIILTVSVVHGWRWRITTVRHTLHHLPF